ncbi:carbonic anhydrase 1-like [Haemaphysalis longicornis]
MWHAANNICLNVITNLYRVWPILSWRYLLTFVAVAPWLFSAIGEAMRPGCWTYDNEQAWSWSFVRCIGNNSCGGSLQSPVNIDKYGVVHDLAMEPLHFEGHQVPLHKFVLNVNGLMLTLRASPSDQTNRTVRGGRLPGTFTFHSALFHWGSTSISGSEHRIDGAAYPMELQLVYAKEKPDGRTALNTEDGVAIIATLYEVSYAPFNSVLAMRQVVSALEARKKRPRSLRRLLPWMARRQPSDKLNLSLEHLLPERRDEFYAYQGSLTMPPCTEPVHWIVFNRRAYVTEAQLSEFRRVPGWTKIGLLSDNYRPPQRLNGRPIFSSFPTF